CHGFLDTEFVMGREQRRPSVTPVSLALPFAAFPFAVGHRQAANPLRCQFFRGVGSQFSTCIICYDPGGPRPVQRHVQLCSDVLLPHVASRVLPRPAAIAAPLPPAHLPRHPLPRPRPLPQRWLPPRAVPPPRVPQRRVDGQPAERAPVGVSLAMPPVHLV